jgi:hypothetical protein
VVNIQAAEGMMSLTIEPEVKEVLDNHGEELKEHDSRIKYLEIESAKSGQTLEYLKQSQDEMRDGMKRIENITLNSNNSILTALNSLIMNRENNETSKEINKENNKNGLYIKIITAIGLIGGSFFAGKNL